MSWSPGADRIRQLLQDGELEPIVPSLDLAMQLADDAKKHLSSARAIAEDGDLAGAYQLAYDALRKSAAALLAAQGLRPTSHGGHVAVEDAVKAQFGSTVVAFGQFGRVRRGRNRFEYPDHTSSEATREDVDDALSIANEAATRTKTILEQDMLTPWTG